MNAPRKSPACPAGASFRIMSVIGMVDD
jgi:hypothetical protein